MQWSSSVVVNRWPWSFRKSIAAMICGRAYEFVSALTTCMHIFLHQKSAASCMTGGCNRMQAQPSWGLG